MINIEEILDYKKQYEYYFTYDKPIPYIAKSVVSRRKFLQHEIELLESKKKLSEQQITLLSDFKKEFADFDDKILYIHEVLMSDYLNFYMSVNCLVLEKNKIADPKIISMSYLDFLFYIIDNDENGQIYANMLINILQLCCHIKFEDIRYIKDSKGKIRLILNGIEYDKTDFNNIKEIICYQNMPDYENKYLDPELEKELNEANELQNQNQGSTTLERQLICVSKEYSYKIQELYDIPIRKFVQMLQIADAQLHYKIYKTGECSGMVSFKTPITHYLYVKNSKFDSLISYESFKEKMKQVT